MSSWSWRIANTPPLGRRKHAVDLDGDKAWVQTACDLSFVHNQVEPESTDKVIICVQCLITVGESIDDDDDRKYRGS